jgi:hypothetical protein
VIKKTGAARASASSGRVFAYAGDTISAAKVETAEGLTRPGSTISVLGGNVITNL